MLINFHEKGQFKLLLTSATNLLLEFPSSSELYNFIGAANKGLGELESSIIAYNKAVALKPDYADAYYNRGIALEQKGQLKEAINSYKKAIENRADYPKAFWNLSGTAEQINEAKSWIEKCLLVDPEYEQAKLTLCALDIPPPKSLRKSTNHSCPVF
jgi:tetratricopeptide (TPR) repeat protein